jgi:hypothetical protein
MRANHPLRSAAIFPGRRGQGGQRPRRCRRSGKGAGRSALSPVLEQLESRQLLAFTPLFNNGVLTFTGTGESDTLQIFMQNGSGSTVLYNNGALATQAGVSKIVIQDIAPDDNSNVQIVGFGGASMSMQGTNFTFGGVLPIQTINIESVSLDSGANPGSVQLDGSGPLGRLAVANADRVTIGATERLQVGQLSVAASSLDLKGQVVVVEQPSLTKIVTGSATFDIGSTITVSAPITAPVATLAASAGIVTLRSRAGILQTAGSALTSRDLVVDNVVSGNVVLDTARNAVRNLHAHNRSEGGAVRFANADSLNIFPANGGSTGIVANDGGVSISSGGTLSLSAQVDAGEGTVSLFARNGITSVAAAGIIGTTLTVSNGVVPGVAPASGDIGLDVAANNRVDVLAAVNVPAAGSIRFKNSTGLGIGVGTDGVAGVTANGGTITISSATGAVAIGAQVTATNLGSVSLSAAEGITQAGSGTITALNLAATNTGTAGAIVLELSGNDVSFVSGKNAADNGIFRYRDAGDVSVGLGGITVDGDSGSVLLTASGSIGQLAAVTAHSLRAVNDNVAAGSIALSLATNDVAEFEAQNLFSGGSVSFVNKSAYAIGSFGIDADGNAVTLTVPGGLTQAGSITARSLGIRRTADGDVDLLDTANDVDVLTVAVGATAGRVAFADADGLSIGRLPASTVGIQAPAAAVSLAAGGDGMITQTGSVVAGSLAVSSDIGNIVLVSNVNDVATFTGSSTSGNISYRDASALAIGDDGIMTAGNVSITVGGALTQTGAIIADDLRAVNLATAGGAITLGLADNDVSTVSLLNAAAAAIDYRDATGFTVGAGGINGRAGISLTSGGDMLQDAASGAIVGRALVLANLNETAGDILLDRATNNVTSLAAVNEALEGDILVRDVGGLSIGVAGAGITANLGDVTIITGGPLALAADVNAGQNDITPSSVTLSASGGIAQSAGSVVTNELSLFNSTTASITLSQPTNDVDQLAAGNLGNVTYVDIDSFSTGINRTGPLAVEVSTKGVLQLTALGGPLRVVSGLSYGTVNGVPQLFLKAGTDRVSASTVEFVPTSTGDNPAVGAAFAGTLRDMIRYANVNQGRLIDPNGFTVMQPQKVVFDEDGYAVETITLAAALPAITQRLAFDGTRVEGTVSDYRVGIDGSAVTAAGANGLVFSGNAGSSTVAGMAIHGFAKGAGIQFQSGDGRVTNSFLGLTRTGQPAGNLYGVDLPSKAATAIRIGGTPADDGVLDGDLANVIGSNTVAGVMVRGGAAGNTIIGNFIGTNAAGDDLGNGTGIVINATASTTVTGNIIGSNKNAGVLLDSAKATATTANVVQGNTIVDNGLGKAAGAGIRVSASTFAAIGAAGAGNTIGRNATGILVDKASTSTTVAGNFVGTNAAGEDLGNLVDGIRMVASTGNTLGGATADDGNTVAFNGVSGIRVENSNATSLTAGNKLLSNRVRNNVGDGIVVAGGGRTTIGTPGSGNVVTENGGDGIRIGLFGTFGSVGNSIQGNLVGTDSATDDTPLGNVGRGISIFGGSGNVVDQGNVVRFNEGGGILVEGSSSNVIGSSVAGQGNVISDNGADGIMITDGAARRPTQNNSVFGNTIADNTGNGIRAVGSGVLNTTIGTATVNGKNAGAPNQILGNEGYGVGVESGASRVQIQGNAIEGSGLGGIFTAAGTNAGVVAPTITSAVIVQPLVGSSQVLVKGTVTGTPRQVLAIDVFATRPDPNETRPVAGRTYLGRITVTVGANGTGAFSATLLLGTARVDDLITATATLTTLPVGSTSQFSAVPVAIAAATVPNVASGPAAGTTRTTRPVVRR